jgi:hypothetical protein
MCETVDGVWIGEWIYLLHLPHRLGTTSNYSATDNIHNSQMTTAPAKCFPACCIFSSRSWQWLLTVEIPQLPALGSFHHRLPYWIACSSGTRQTLLIIFRHEAHRKQLSIFIAPKHLDCCLRIRCGGKLFAEPLSRNCPGIVATLAVIV